MKNVAIITIHSINFGNRLQNYALQESIKALGYNVHTVRRKKDLHCKEAILDRMKDRLRMLLKTRKGLYMKFDRDNISFSKYSASANDVESGLEESYDYFITGSDQVWNPFYDYIVGKSELLCFTEKEKKISYAASFGVEDIPADKQEMFIRALKDFKAISVREKSGVNLVRSLTGNDAVVTLDPTLLLNADQYRKISRRPVSMPCGKYALLYLLGGESMVYHEYVQKNVDANSLFIYDVLQMNKEKRIAVGPAEFLYLLDHAEIVLTDSFHATAFSLLFRKPVITFPREGLDMSSRIVTLASTVGLESNFMDNGIFYIGKNENYTEIDKLLTKARERSIEFLKEAIL